VGSCSFVYCYYEQNLCTRYEVSEENFSQFLVWLYTTVEMLKSNVGTCNGATGLDQ